MIHFSLPIYVKLMVVALAASTLLVKYKYKRQYNAKSRRPIGYRWLGWYRFSEIQGTTSDRYRQFMSTNNRTTTIFWLLFTMMLLAISLG